MPDSRMIPTIVLLVEDEPLVRMFADEVLTDDGGFKVVATANADEALAILRARPDVRVLFTDVTMPGSMDGLELAHVAKRMWPYLAIIVTSARGLDRALPDGARFLQKPYAPTLLVQTVQAMLAQRPAPIILPRPPDHPSPGASAPAVLPRATLGGPTMGNGLTGGVAQPLPDPEE